MANVQDLFGKEFIDDESKDAPISNEIKNQDWQTGRYAEFMVCAFLTCMGHHAVHVDTVGFDIILTYGGQSYRVDVKGTKFYHRGVRSEGCKWGVLKNKRSGSSKWKGRAVTPDDADLLALFHHSFGTVIFIPILAPIRQIWLPAQQVRNAGIGENSLALAIEQLRAKRKSGD